NEIADDRGYGRTTPSSRRQPRAAPCRLFPPDLRGHFGREPENAVVDEEEPGKIVLADQRELMLQALPRAIAFGSGRREVALVQALFTDASQLLDGAAPIDLGRGQAVPEVLRQIEGAPLRDADGVRCGLGVVH